MQQGYNAERPIKYYQITGATLDGGSDLATLLGEAIPSGADLVLIRPETQAIRWRDDGTVPTASVGMPLAVAETLRYTAGRLANLKLISQTAGAVLNIAFYAH